MSEVETANSDKDLQFLIERFETHHSHVSERIENICQNAQFLCTSMSELTGTKAALVDILDAVAALRRILEKTGSVAGTDLVDYLTEALKGLASDLNRLRECHELRQHLRLLEENFSVCHYEITKPKDEMDINMETVGLLWKNCKKNLLTLVEFMESATHINQLSSGESGRVIEVEDWIGDLCNMRNSIDDDLREKRLKSLKESTSKFSGLLDTHSVAADQYLEDIIAKFCDQVSQHMGKIS